MKYCRFCGAQLADAAVWCPSCQRSLIPSYTLTLIWEKQFYFGKPVIKLTVDGKEVYTIANGETLTLTLPCGQHTLFFRFASRSKTVTVDLQRDIRLLVGGDKVGGGVAVYET